MHRSFARLLLRSLGSQGQLQGRTHVCHGPSSDHGARVGYQRFFRRINHCPRSLPSRHPLITSVCKASTRGRLMSGPGCRCPNVRQLCQTYTLTHPNSTLLIVLNSTCPLFLFFNFFVPPSQFCPYGAQNTPTHWSPCS